MKLKNFFKLSALSLITIASLNVSAKEDSSTPDPADVTKVLTALKVQAGTNGKDNNPALEAELKIGGSFNKNNSFLTMISAMGAEKDSDKGKPNGEDDFDLREYRMRWFQVFGTGYAAIPKAGYSVDYIDHSNDDTDMIDNIIAVGGIVKVPVLSNWVMYPNLAAVQANVNNDAKNAGVDDGKGFQVNVFNAIYLSKKGTYLMINPQYSWIDFDAFTTQTLLIETTLGMPLTDSKKWWFNATYKETLSKLDSDTAGLDDESFKSDDDARQFRVGVTYVF